MRGQGWLGNTDRKEALKACSAAVSFAALAPTTMPHIGHTIPLRPYSCLSDKASPACSQVHRLRMVAAIHLTTDSVTSASMPHAILPGPVPPVLSLSYFQVLYLLVYLTSGCRTCLYTQGCHQLADLCWLSISDSSHFKIFIQSTNAGA